MKIPILIIERLSAAYLLPVNCYLLTSNIFETSKDCHCDKAQDVPMQASATDGSESQPIGVAIQFLILSNYVVIVLIQ